MMNKLSLWNLRGKLISSLQLWSSPVSLESLLLVPGASAIQEGPPGEAQEGPVSREQRTFIMSSADSENPKVRRHPCRGGVLHSS